MPFSLIRGSFHITNYSPDGDSIRFEPENQDEIRSLRGGKRAKFNQRGHIQLRIEAIDTLETHYPAPSGGVTLHQPLALADQGTSYLLEHLGFDLTNVSWDSRHKTVVAADPVSVPGFILTRSVERNGRPVAFVFRDGSPTPGLADEGGYYLTPALLRESYNYAALREGIAYPTFYQGLFSDLRAELTAAATHARTNTVGVYATDRTTSGFAATNLAVITDEVPIMPKLFRRLSDYMVSTGSAVGFKDSLAKVREKVFDLRSSNFTHFDTFIEQAGTDIRLTRRPEELVFDESQPQRGPVLASLLTELDMTSTTDSWA